MTEPFNAQTTMIFKARPSIKPTQKDIDELGTLYEKFLPKQNSLINVYARWGAEQRFSDFSKFDNIVRNLFPEFDIFTVSQQPFGFCFIVGGIFAARIAIEHPTINNSNIVCRFLEWDSDGQTLQTLQQKQSTHE